MFPINYNDPYAKNDGSIVPVGDVIGGGGGSDLPDYDETDAGKVLAVDDTGNLEWVTITAINQYERTKTNIDNVNIPTNAKGV